MIYLFHKSFYQGTFTQTNYYFFVLQTITCYNGDISSITKNYIRYLYHIQTKQKNTFFNLSFGEQLVKFTTVRRYAYVIM